MTQEQLAAVANWLGEYGRAIRWSDDGLTIADDEISFEVRRNAPGRWEVRKTWRDEDRGLVFAADSAEDVDRYLTLVSANDIRRRIDLRPLRHGISTDPAGIAVPAEGFTLTGDLDHGFTMVDTRTHRSWRFGSDIEAARFSLYADVPVGRLRAAVLSPST